MKRRAAVVLASVVITLAGAAWAQKVTVSTDPDQIQIGHSIFIDKNQNAAGDLVCIGCPITLQGTSKGDAIAIGNHVTIDGRIKGDVVAVGGGVRLGPGADVGGDVVTVGGHLDRDPAAVVHGSVVSHMGHHALGPFMGVWFLASLAGLIPFSIILALICYAIAGNARVQNVASTLAIRTGWSVLAGIGVIVAGIALSALFARFSGALVVVLWCAIFAASILGFTGLSALIGRRLSATATPVVVVVIGALVVGVLESIPILGGIALLLFLLFALGSAVISGYGSAPGWMEQRLGPPSAGAATPGS